MSTISLYQGKFSQMSGMLSNTSTTINCIKTSFDVFKSRALSIDSKVCQMDNTINMINKTYENLNDFDSLLNDLDKQLGEFEEQVIKIDNSAGELIKSKKNDFYDKYSYLKPDCEKNFWQKAGDKLKKVFNWIVECWKEIVIAITAIAVIALTWPYSAIVIAFVFLCTSLRSDSMIINEELVYDENSPESMAECLGIDYEEYIETMKYQYGLDEETAQLYLKLYINIANSPSMRHKSQREIACEFNRVIASLCINYDGSAKRWKLTTGNYRTIDAFNSLMNEYGLTEAEATDLVIALNLQHGNTYEAVEDQFREYGNEEKVTINGTVISKQDYTFSRENGNLYKGPNPPEPSDFQNRAASSGNTVMKDLVHEAIQYVEYNDKLNIIDYASGSTDRMISYSGDIISTRYDESDFMSDIDPNNIQKRFIESGNNFIAVQQNYNNDVRNGVINPKEEFINNNGGIEKIRKNIISDIKSTMGGYIDGSIGGNKKERVEKYENNINDFINFLTN